MNIETILHTFISLMGLIVALGGASTYLSGKILQDGHGNVQYGQS